MIGLIRQCLVKSPERVAFLGFAIQKVLAGKNFFKFQSKYADKAIEKENKAPMLPLKVNHPYNNPHNPVNFNGIKSSELFYNFIGLEQVSPHYEKYIVARKYFSIT